MENLQTDPTAELENLRNRLGELERQRPLGLYWRDIPEQVERRLVTEVPVLAAQPQLDIHGRDPEDIPHVIIEGDNLHALHTLQATHRETVDVIYIDPPYNTGTENWIYNDRYVDTEDTYRNSKWLAFLSKRLTLARSLLAPTGVMAISIGKDEVHRLALLCEQLFPNRAVHAVTVQTSGGKPSGGLTYLHEYLLLLLPETFTPSRMSFTGGKSRTPWEGMTLATFNKVQRPNQAYPIFVHRKTGKFAGTGPSLAEQIKDGSYKGTAKAFKFKAKSVPQDCEEIWPVTAKGEECVWRLIPSRLLADWKAGYISVSTNIRKSHVNKFSVQYLPSGVISKIKSGKIEVFGTEAGVPTLKLGTNETTGSDIPTIWTEQNHHTTKGTEILKAILGNKDFPYPKPLQLMVDILDATSQGNKSALVLDFFAGSGTTLHAVAQLNDNDGDQGQRRCILITNNENEICRKVTRPRVSRALSGNWSNGTHDSLPGAVQFYTTEFITRHKNLDRMRSDIAKHTVELVALKESALRTVEKLPSISVLHSVGSTIAVVTAHAADHKKLCAIAESHVRTNDKRLAYLFTWSEQGIEVEIAANWDGWLVQPLPADMLAALRRTVPHAELFAPTTP